MNEHQRLILSAWLPLGINNLMRLKERIQKYLNEKQQELQLIDWDGQVQTYDLYVTFTIHFNSPYSQKEPDVLEVQTRYFGWGYIEFSLVSEKHSLRETTLDPILVNKLMEFLLGKARVIIVGTLMPHQHNYLANILVSRGDEDPCGVLEAKRYLKAAIDNDLQNGIMDGASNEDILQAFRFEPRVLAEESNVADRRNFDLFSKTLVLRYNSSLQPRSYDSIDQDFSEYSQVINEQQYVRGKHRSSIILWEKTPPNGDVVMLTCSSNALIRFVRHLHRTMVTAREQLSLVRITLLEHQLMIKFEQEIPDVLKVPRIDDIGREKVEKHLKHLQGYVQYLLARIPLLDEIVHYTIEGREKLEFCRQSVLDRTNNPNNIEFINGEGQKRNQLEDAIFSLNEYINDLVKTSTRIQKGLSEEINSVSRLIQIYDQEASLTLLGILPRIENVQVETKRLTERQEFTQKRALESQFVQSELARSGEAREKTRGRLTQASGAVVFGGFISVALKSFIAGIVTLLNPGTPFQTVNDSTWLNILLPLISTSIGWIVAGSFVARAGAYKDMVEVVFPFEPDLLEDVEKDILVFIEESLLALEKNRRFHRVRLEGNTFRITWEDEVEVTVNKKLLWIPRTKRESKGALVTLEYRNRTNNCILESMSISMERSREYGKDVKEMRVEIIETASKRLHEVNGAYTVHQWAGFLESKLIGADA
ncbi:MAG: hypothetical protein ACFFCP_15230 [Promethearchaeota archaeon]